MGEALRKGFLDSQYSVNTPHVNASEPLSQLTNGWEVDFGCH